MMIKNQIFKFRELARAFGSCAFSSGAGGQKSKFVFLYWQAAQLLFSDPLVCSGLLLPACSRQIGRRSTGQVPAREPMTLGNKREARVERLVPQVYPKRVAPWPSIGAEQKPKSATYLKEREESRAALGAP